MASVSRAAARMSSLAMSRSIHTSRLTIQRSRWHTPARLRAHPVASQLQLRGIADGTQSREAKPSKIYDFAKINELTSSSADSKPILIDVREPHEYNAGHIPGAVNLPVQSQPDALFLNEEEFEDRFGMAKPKTGEEVVFYCKAGVRSKAAAQFARQNGYHYVGEYPGSWMDWVKNGGEERKP